MTISTNDIFLSLAFLKPNANWSWASQDYADLEWYDEDTKPTLDELEAALPDAIRARAFVGLRSERNQRLAESDWTQVADAPVDQVVWAEYRQALRDLPENTTDPENPVWPTPPA